MLTVKKVRVRFLCAALVALLNRVKSCEFGSRNNMNYLKYANHFDWLHFSFCPLQRENRFAELIKQQGNLLHCVQSSFNKRERKKTILFETVSADLLYSICKGERVLQRKMERLTADHGTRPNTNCFFVSKQRRKDSIEWNMEVNRVGEKKEFFERNNRKIQ